jgi:low affinity Fe/Cu permease
MEIDDPGVGPAPVDRKRWVHSRVEAGSSPPTWRRGMFRTAASSPHARGWSDRHWSSRWLYRVGEVVAHAAAGIVAAILVVGWALVGLVTRFPAWWETVLYSVTASVTFVMVFVIQHTQTRQTAAVQRKLDELLRASVHADDTLIAVEEAPDEHLHALASLNLADRERATAEIRIEDDEHV